jgi:hypothetical protein
MILIIDSTNLREVGRRDLNLSKRTTIVGRFNYFRRDGPAPILGVASQALPAWPAEHSPKIGG